MLVGKNTQEGKEEILNGGVTLKGVGKFIA
jgi:hypothetical protein